jgi:cell wall-associated NlpC family hydrolase
MLSVVSLSQLSGQLLNKRGNIVKSGSSDKNSDHAIRDSLTNFARSLLGKPYCFGSTGPSGFDCSGFVYRVFSTFHMELPRSSYTMGERGTTIDTSEAEKGDLIFFKGTDINNNDVGHVGIIISEKGQPIEFIHSSSNSKKSGVVISALNSGHYRKRFITVKRVIDNYGKHEY